MLQRRTMIGLLCGLLGGIIAWALIQFTGWFRLYLDGADSFSSLAQSQSLGMGLLYGAILGASLLTPQLYGKPFTPTSLVTLFVWSSCGAIGGTVGIHVAQIVFNTLLLSHDTISSYTVQEQLLHDLVASEAGWSVLGVGVGLGLGIARKAWRAIIYAMLGGLMGGLAGGGFYELISLQYNNLMLSRLCAFIFISAALGHFLELTQSPKAESEPRIPPLIMPGIAPIVNEADPPAILMLEGDTTGSNVNIMPREQASELSGAVGTAKLVGTRLTVIHGPYYEHLFSLSDDVDLTVGRSSKCEIALPNDKAVSRQHARIFTKSGRHMIEDLASANGTFVTEFRLDPRKPKLLWLGDLVRIGDTIMRYE